MRRATQSFLQAFLVERRLPFLWGRPRGAPGRLRLGGGQVGARLCLSALQGGTWAIPSPPGSRRLHWPTTWWVQGSYSAGDSCARCRGQRLTAAAQSAGHPCTGALSNAVVQCPLLRGSGSWPAANDRARSRPARPRCASQRKLWNAGLRRSCRPSTPPAPHALQAHVF